MQKASAKTWSETAETHKPRKGDGKRQVPSKCGLRKPERISGKPKLTNSEKGLEAPNCGVPFGWLLVRAGVRWAQVRRSLTAAGRSKAPMILDVFGALARPGR